MNNYHHIIRRLS